MQAKLVSSFFFSSGRFSSFVLFIPRRVTDSRIRVGCFPEGSVVSISWQVLLGDMGAGKSSLALRFVKGQFFDYQVRVVNLLNDNLFPNLMFLCVEFWSLCLE